MTSTDGGPEQYIRTDHLEGDIEGRSVRGGAITSVAQVAKSLLTVGSTLVLARLLTPEDFGLVAMVTAVTGFLSMFKDMGLSMVTVQREEISQAQISALFWINAALGLVITVALAALSWGLAWFYQQPEVMGVAIVLALSFMVDGLTVQHEALMRRQMRYRALAIAEVVSVAAGVAAAVILAWQGFSYWALVANLVVFSAVNLVAIWIACPWRPAAPGRTDQMWELLRFGANITGFSFVNYFARNLDDVLIGRFHGANELGLYQKAYEILMVPITQINRPASRVAIPALSRLADDESRYRRAYLRILEKLLLVTMPVGALLILASDWVVLVILGDQWVDAALIFAALGVSIFAQAIGNTTGWLFISQDRTDEMFRWGFIGAGTALFSFVIGLPWGALGVAVAYSAVGVLVRTPWLLWFVGRRGPVMTLDFYRVAWPGLVAALGSAAAVGILRWATIFEVSVVNLIISIPLAAVGALALTCAYGRGRAVLVDGWRLLRHLRRAGEDDDELDEALLEESSQEKGEDHRI